jgi:hypothetical protein
VVLHNPLTQGEADSATRLVSAVQPLKNAEYLFMVFGIDPRAIVFDREDGRIFFMT